METKPVTVNTLLLSAAAIIFIQLIADVAIAKGVLPQRIGEGLARVFQIVAMVIIVRLGENDLKSIGISNSNLINGLKRGLIWSLGFGVIAGFVFGILFLFEKDVLKYFKTPIPIRFGDILLFFCVGGLIAPIAEELFFRGLLYGYFRRWGFASALLISISIFVLLHLAGQSGFNLSWVVGGLLFAIAYEVEKNLLVPIVIHCLGNLAIFSLAFML